MCLRKSLCSIQFIFFTFFWSITVVFGQQNYPIQLNVQLIPPYSGYLPDYATAGNEKLKVILLQKDLTQPTYNVRLAMRLEGNGYTISTKPFFKGQPITLQAGVPVEISGSDIYDFLNSVNLDFTGLNKNTYEQGQALPEGYYSICFTAYDYNSPTPSQVSNQSCAQAWMTLSDPPFLNFPICGSTVQTNTPQNVVFGWTPMNTGSPNSANQTEYIFELWETRPDNNANPNNIVLSAPPVQTYTTDFTTFNYGMTETQLIAGMQYIWRVRAHDKSNRDLFKNQGYSQICTFIYGSIYDGLNLNLTANSQGISYRQGKVWWNGLSVFTQYTIQYRKVNGATSTWFTAYSTAPELKINDLEENTAYEAKVQGIANDGYIGQWSNTTTFTTPTKPIIACGDQIVPQPGQTIVPLAFATQGMRFKAGLFEVLVTSVQGGAGYFTGTGKVFVPMFGSLLNVTFDNVFVDDNQTVLSGNFYAVTKGITNWLHDYDVTTAEDNAVTVPGSISGVSVNGSQYCYTTTVNGTSTQSCVPIPPNTNVVVIRDDNGNQYTIQVIPAPPTVTGPTNYLNNTTDDLQICDSLTVTFEASTNQIFGFDKKEYTAYIPNYEVFTTPSNKKYFIPYKSIGEGQTDVVLANIQINNFNASKLSFKTQNGTVLNAINQGTNQYVVSNIPATANCVYAYYNNKKVGKLNIVSLKPITKKVVIVPVNGTSNSITASLLNGIFKQANVAWTLTTASAFNFNLGSDGLQEADATLLAKYSIEMRALRDAYKQANSNYDKDAYYIFVVPNFSIAQLKGYMVRGRALGFVTANATIKEVAHELAHGAFGLEHTFPKLEQSSSNNLLDYGAGTQLTKLQWDEIQNPNYKPLLSWEDGEEDGSYQACNETTANLAYGVLLTKLNDCVSSCNSNNANNYCLQRDKLTVYTDNVCSEALAKLSNDERYNIIKNISDGFNYISNNLHKTEEEAIIRLLRTLPKSKSNCDYIIQKLEANSFSLLQKLRTGIDGDNYSEFIAQITQISEISKPFVAVNAINVDEQIFRWNGSNGGINFTIQFNQQGLLSAVIHTNTSMGYKNVILNPFNNIGILSKVKLPGVKNSYNGKFYSAMVPAIYLQWLYDKGESEGAKNLAFAAGSILTLQGGVGLAINSTNNLIKVFGILEATSGISSLALDNTPIESEIVTKYGANGQAFITNVRFCLNMYNLASGTGQLIKLTTSYASAKSFWASNRTQIKNENIIAQAEFDQFDNFLDEARLLSYYADETEVIVNGAKYFSKKFGINNTTVYLKKSVNEIEYFFPDNLSTSFASFEASGSSFVPNIQIPELLKNQGIGKSIFNDAFTKLGGYNKFDEIESSWVAGTMGDNFASFKNALLNGKTPQEAAFSTATGAWSLELGYSKVVLEPAHALQIKNGLRSNISVDFTK